MFYLYFCNKDHKRYINKIIFGKYFQNLSYDFYLGRVCVLPVLVQAGGVREELHVPEVGRGPRHLPLPLLNDVDPR